MGFYKNREQYNSDFCRTHHLVKHKHPNSIEDPTPRESFFRINDEEEMLTAHKNWSHDPCVVMVGLSGGLINKGGSIRQGTSNILMFLSKLKLDPENPIKATAITEAYDITFEVMRDYVSKALNDTVENDGCGTFKNLEPSRFKWEQTGPIGDEFYGWILEYADELGRSIIQFNPDHFIEPA
jgi:hypothetical protein